MQQRYARRKFTTRRIGVNFENGAPAMKPALRKLTEATLLADALAIAFSCGLTFLVALVALQFF